MKYILYVFLICGFFADTTIYSFSVNKIDSGQINFSDFQGKKILLVNIATNSPKTGQLGELQQLQQLYADSLVVIGFPSNSFGNETRNNAAIKQFCDSAYGVSFELAVAGSVKGSGQQAIYSWLTQASQNSVMNSEVKGDFQKYLIDSKGELLGVFTASVSPLDKQITDLITDSFH